MKINVHPRLTTRSVLALGFGCALATTPLGSILAQNSTPGIPASAGEVDTTKQDSTNAQSTVPKPAVPAEKTGEKLTGKEKQFLNHAGEANAVEAMMGELALKKSESPAVKDFAQKMVTEHKQANADLAAISESHGLGKFEPMPTSEDKAKYAALTSLTGKAFDDMYAKDAVAGHEKALKEYKMAETEVKDPALSDYTTKTAKTVAEHLQMAEELKKSH